MGLQSLLPITVNPQWNAYSLGQHGWMYIHVWSHDAIKASQDIRHAYRAAYKAPRLLTGNIKLAYKAPRLLTGNIKLACMVEMHCLLIARMVYKTRQTCLLSFNSLFTTVTVTAQHHFREHPATYYSNCHHSAPLPRTPCNFACLPVR